MSGGLFSPVASPLTPERVARLCELAWWDGAFRGAVLGLLAGFLAGVVVACLLRNGGGHGPAKQ